MYFNLANATKYVLNQWFIIKSMYYFMCSEIFQKGEKVVSLC